MIDKNFNNSDVNEAFDAAIKKIEEIKNTKGYNNDLEIRKDIRRALECFRLLKIACVERGKENGHVYEKVNAVLDKAIKTLRLNSDYTKSDAPLTTSLMDLVKLIRSSIKDRKSHEDFNLADWGFHHLNKETVELVDKLMEIVPRDSELKANS